MDPLQWRHNEPDGVSNHRWLFAQPFVQAQIKENIKAWWRHQMETFSALLAICAGNSPVAGEFLAQRPVTRSFDVFFDLRPNKRLSKQSRGYWSETPSSSLWRHRNGSASLAFVRGIHRWPVTRKMFPLMTSSCSVIPGNGLLPTLAKPLLEPLPIYCQ